MEQPRRTFTLDGTEVNRVGLGTNRLTDTKANRAFLGEAVAAGLGFIDTAHLYSGGESEATVGAALAPFPDDLVVATKGGYRSNSTETLRAEIEESFDRLRTETFDLWYLHRVHDDAPFEATLELVREYVDAGRIRNVGLSAVSVEQIRAARAIVPVAAVQNEYGLGNREHEDVVSYCASEEILFVPYYPLAGEETAALREVASNHDASTNQIRIAWLLQRAPWVVPIPGTLSVEHLRDNIAALEIELSDEERWAIEAG
jgi:aryl-alcohol dehydrogenase-like predicted oxidoreductase